MIRSSNRIIGKRRLRLNTEMSLKSGRPVPDRRREAQSWRLF
ncbi:MAG: hypothetical protein AB1651_00240 [Pseudomonadota bacterium]